MGLGGTRYGMYAEMHPPLFFSSPSSLRGVMCTTSTLPPTPKWSARTGLPPPFPSLLSSVFSPTRRSIRKSFASRTETDSARRRKRRISSQGERRRKGKGLSPASVIVLSPEEEGGRRRPRSLARWPTLALAGPALPRVASD